MYESFDEEWEREERKESITFMFLGVLIVGLVVAIVVGFFALMREETENIYVEADVSQVALDENIAHVQGEAITPQLLNPSEAVIDIENEEKNHTESPEVNDHGLEDIKKEEYIIYDSNVRYLTASDLNVLSEWEIRLARNEIFARYGRMFDALELKEYFEDKSWYKPTIPAVEFNTSCLNNIEMENLNFIINYEKAHNLN